MNKAHNILDKLDYAKRCLEAHPEEEPRLRLFVRWLYGEALADEVTQHLAVLTRPPALNPNQMDMFQEST